jgi:Flp pilus assembly protein TadG
MVKAEKIICNRGAAAVEAAIILPLLLLITFAVIEYGWLFLKSQQITNAARNGARVAIRYVPGEICADTTARAKAQIDDLMAKARISGYSVNVICPPNVGDPLTVTVSVPGEKVDIINFPFIPKPTTLGASVTMSKEGP